MDALKELGLPISPEHEARLRAICDEEVVVTIDGSRVIQRTMTDGISTKDGVS